MSSPALLLLIFSVTIAYFNSFAGSFQFDDFNVIVDNPLVHSWGAWVRDLPGGIRPLLKLSYTLNWTSGLGLFGFHLFNLLIHALNSIVIFSLSRKFFGGYTACHTDTAALLTALFFALHPVQTEAVTYISGRSMSLMTFFYLLSILFYVRGVAEGKRVLLLILSPLFFVMAVLVKETAVTLPLALILWELTGKPPSSWRTVLGRQYVHWLLLFLIFSTFAVHKGYTTFFFSSFDARGIGLNLVSQISGIMYLLSRFAALNGLNIDPDLPVVSGWSPGMMLKALFLTGIAITGLFTLRSRTFLGFGILWFFLHLVPTNSVVPRIDIANERHLYLASWGIFLIAGQMIPRIAGKFLPPGVPVLGAAVIIMILLCSFTISRNQAYRSEIALWEDTVGKSPLKPRAHNNLGYAYFLAGRYEDTKREYLEALRLNPDYVKARNNLADLEAISKKNKGP